MTGFILLAATLLLPQAKNEAEELFKKMEEKILQSKTIQAKVKGSLEGGKIDVTVDVLAGEANRGRVDVEMKAMGSTRTFGSISDGKTMQTTAAEGMKMAPAATPETFGALIRKSLAIMGGLSATEAFSPGQSKANPETAYKVSEFVLGPKGKVGEIEAQMVQYKVATKYDTDITMMVWIDPKTNLPVKRSIVTKTKSGEETYPELKIDEKIDAAKFEHPKEAK